MSYIGLSSIVRYTDQELNDVAPQLKGRLTKVHMQQLFNAVAGCKKMVNREILLVGNALRMAF